MSFLPEQTDRSRIPVVIVSGFLGSGKTTLINRMLKDPRLERTAVAINEFGEVPIDQHLIDHGDEKTIVMANGCLCCNLSGDMESALMRVFSRREEGQIPDFDRLIIEPSGLSDPAPIAHAILRHPVMSRAFSLLPLVATVDASLAENQIVRFPEVKKQISLADTLVITKTDLVEAPTVLKLKNLLSQLNPLATQCEATIGSLEPDAIFSSRFLNPDASLPAVQFIDRIADHKHDDGRHIETSGLTTISLEANSALPWPALDGWLRKIRIANGERLLRIKGICNIEGSALPVVIQAVEHVQSVPVQLERWPAGNRTTHIVLIGEFIDRDGIAASWRTMCAHVPSVAAK